MNVLVWSSWVATPPGGQERVALEIALRVRERGHRVVLVGAYDNSTELRACIPSDLPYHFFDLHASRIKPHFSAARLLNRIMEEEKIEVVSAHGSVFAPHEVCRRRNRPLVWTVHGAEESVSRNPLARLKHAAAARVMNYPRTHAVGVSRATAEIIRRTFPSLDPARLHVIHNGIIAEESLSVLSLPRPGPPWRLGFVGRLVERKRPLDLVDVARQLAGQLDFMLHVFGDGPLLEALTMAVRDQRLEKYFVMHGYWTKGSAGIMEQLDILVHPDSKEPFGGALLEAQLSGRPVVAYRVGGNPEIVDHGNTGWLVPAGDTAALVKGIQIIAGADFEKFSRASRERAATEFSLAKMTNEYLALFGKLCA